MIFQKRQWKMIYCLDCYDKLLSIDINFCLLIVSLLFLFDRDGICGSAALEWSDQPKNLYKINRTVKHFLEGLYCCGCKKVSCSPFLMERCMINVDDIGPSFIFSVVMVYRMICLCIDVVLGVGRRSWSDKIFCSKVTSCRIFASLGNARESWWAFLLWTCWRSWCL